MPLLSARHPSLRSWCVGGWNWQIGDGALPLLKHPHVGGASLSQGQDGIAQVDVVEPRAAEGGV